MEYVRVHFDLICCWNTTAFVDESLQLQDTEIRYTLRGSATANRFGQG